MAQHDDKAVERLNRELAKYEALDNAEIDQVIQTLLGDNKGQKFIWWLLQVGKYGVQPFTPDAQVTAFQCGEMNVGAQILARLIEVNPLGFAELQLKRKNESDRRDAAARDIASGNDLLSGTDELGSDPLPG